MDLRGLTLRMDTSAVSEGKKCKTEIHRVKFSNVSSLGKNKNKTLHSPGGSVVKNPPANAEDMGSIPDLGRSHKPQSN